MSNERKLLIEPLSFEVANRMANSALPTDEERKEALEQTFAEMRKELHRPEYQPGNVKDTRRPAGTNGWANEVPIGPPPGIAIIDQLCNTLMPHEPLHGADLEKLLAKVGMTREQFEARVAERVKQMKAGVVR
jgi:hypothetical protein